MSALFPRFDLPVDGVTALDIGDGGIIAAREYFDPSGYVRNYSHP